MSCTRAITTATSDELTRKNVAGGDEDPRQVGGGEVELLVDARDAVSACSTNALAVSVTTYCEALKRSLSGALRWIRSAAKLAQIRATTAQAGPATSSAAKAKVVEVVTSPSAPRVTTFKEMSSPANAQTANSMTSGVNSLDRLSPSRMKTDRAAQRTEDDHRGDVGLERR